MGGKTISNLRFTNDIYLLVGSETELYLYTSVNRLF